VADHGQHFSDQGPFTDQGASDFCFRIVPFCGTWQSKDMFQKSMEWAEAPRWVIDSGHAGRLAPQGSFLTVLGEGVMITAMKRAERQDGMIIRLFEGRGRRTVVAISGALLGERHWQGELGPYQLATLRIPDAVEESITMVDLLEEPVAGRGA
jgi:alpha-mannosidase